MNKKWMLPGLALVLAGCGGDDAREPYAEPDYLTDQGGYAADGYLVGATVCLDTDKDLSCTDERYRATTDENGQFSLYAQGSLFEKYEVIVEAIAGVTVDLDNPGTPIEKGYTLRAPAGLKDSDAKIPVTPITTVLAAEKEAAPGKSVLEVIKDSGFAQQLCPLSATDEDKKTCVTSDYVKDAESSDDTTRLLAQRKQLTARVMASMLADAQEQAGDSKGKKASSNTLAAKSNKVLKQVDNAIGENGGNTSDVDTGKLASNNSIVGGEGSNALLNAAEVPAQTTTVLEALKASGYHFALDGSAINGERIDPGYEPCYLFCSEKSHTRHWQFPVNDWSASAGSSSGLLSDDGSRTQLVRRAILSSDLLAEFASAAQKLDLKGRSIGQIMDTFAPSANRKWRHVLDQCSVFGAGATGHIFRKPTYYQFNNPAYGYYGVIPEAVIPGLDLVDPERTNFTFEQHDIETIISNYTASVGAFSVIVGPDVYVTLSGGTAEFFKRSTATSLGTASYRVEGIDTFIGVVRTVIIQDLSAVAEETLYINQARENLGIVVSKNTNIAHYEPTGTFGQTTDGVYGVGVFGSTAADAPQLWLNTAAAKQLQAAVDAAALVNPTGDMDVTVDCDYTVKTGTDSDGDGVDDAEDAFPNDASESGDIDGDGIADSIDSDRDGDGVANDSDAFPNDPTESKDSDGDGVGDNADSDRDGDGILNDEDAFPDDPGESGDLDKDGIGDNADTDRDGDGIPNDEDAAPNDPNSGNDLDGDGIDDSVDADRDGDGVNNDQDAFPDDATETSDLDGDGVGDNSDVDRDGDTVWNDQDAFPDDPTEFSDLDGDGTGDNSDPDRDGDGVNNDVDAFPNDPTETLDSDGDGVGDNSDPTPFGGGTDTDGDGFEDSVDAFPDDPLEWQDTDGDGYGDNFDPDPFDPLFPGEGYCDPVIDPLCDPLFAT